MTAKLIYLTLNLSLLFAILIAPSILMVSLWYRKSLGKPVFQWHKPEMVLTTIVFFILTLVVFIVGVSCFFTHLGYLDPLNFAVLARTQFFNLGLSCMLVIAGLLMVYFAMRNLLIQMVMDDGIVMNKAILPVPTALRLIEWSSIADYYVVADYPNVAFTFIVQQGDLKYGRESIKVPIYLKEDFQSYLDKQLYSAQATRSGSETPSSRFFSEN